MTLDEKCIYVFNSNGMFTWILYQCICWYDMVACPRKMASSLLLKYKINSTSKSDTWNNEIAYWSL